MTSFHLQRLWWTSLRHYWRTNLAMCLGIAVGAAVMTGALIVGDSVRASLRQMTLDRLGQLDFVMTGPRFFRQALETDLIAADGPSQAVPRVSAALLVQAGVEHLQADALNRASQVTVLGVNDVGWGLVGGVSGEGPIGEQAVVNARLAKELNAEVGDTITVWIELPATVPRDTLLGHKDNDAAEVRVTIGRVLPDGPGPARFGLFPTQQQPKNLFIARERLQQALDLAEVRPTRRDPTGQPARCNTLLIADDRESPADTRRLEWEQRIQAAWQPADLALRVVPHPEQPILSIESEQLLLEGRMADAAQAVAKQQQQAIEPVLIYLANSLRNDAQPTAYSMYSTVAGLDLLQLTAPFGPFEFVGEPPASWGAGDLILNEFLATDLKVEPGDRVRMTYHEVGSQGELPEREQLFTVKGVVRLQGPAADRSLTPTVKGITDADNFNDWEQPFPMKLDDVTPRDDEYWDAYRATPKAFLPLAEAQRLWPSRYGSLTSVRVTRPLDQTGADAAAAFARQMMQTLLPSDVGFAVQAVRQDGLRAATGANDFSVLFLSFSMFLIAAAVILVSLLFRLSLAQRISEWGLLGSVGWSPAAIRKLLLSESSVLLCIGAVVGCLAAIGYAHVMIYGLKTWWNGAVGTQLLQVSIAPLSVLLGVSLAVFAAAAAIVVSLGAANRCSLREQLAGISSPSQPLLSERTGSRLQSLGLGTLTAITFALLTVGLSGWLPQSEVAPGLTWPVLGFMLCGLCSLALGVWGFARWLGQPPGGLIRGKGVWPLLQLGMRNASRQAARSTLTTGLIATASFLIVAVAAGRQNPARDEPVKGSGNGGFTLVAETSTPILYSLNSQAGRDKVGLAPRNAPDVATLQAMTVFPFRMQPGEDASCLNLFQATRPTILGVPPEMIARGGFAFAGTAGSNPWSKLLEPSADGTIPVFGDLNTLMFGLKKGLGDVLEVPDSQGQPVRLKIAGMLTGSVFQGVLLMSESAFLKAFPTRRGFQYFLVETDLSYQDAAIHLLEAKLSAYGFDAEPVSQRLARFLSVQNTYLSTFQALGGLGLILGTIGLATVMLRNVLERRSELALLRAVGYSTEQICWLILGENSLLLLWGLLTGTIAAMLAMVPNLATRGAEFSIAGVGQLLLAVTVAGVLGAALAIWEAVRAPVVSSLRGE
jgi:putative ABC transport system permease protein